ncbi:undecaprenyl-diphosphate phosphatase [Helicobacter mesocricetorum]|uniref:undecaprenyl-diphosphate phosphatase n=1 Tax=Helicobacter mesocricetorum TaxID=87012 RepID=UPI000CF065FA|nr:undecaprenyl-diphosphate phosphatase [Helicobacter mesocricetorum]
MDFINAAILGIVEGLTEFLPISSTGHLILVSKLLGIPENPFHKVFEVVIQLGSILAVIFIFWEKLYKNSWDLWIKLMIGFLPAGILGFLFYSVIKSLFNPLIVAIMLIIGGIVFIVVEFFYKEKTHFIQEVSQISYKQALWIGCFQALALIPGTSRSGSTIIGGLLLGCNRKVAAEFSFLLALPAMVVASGYSLYKNYNLLNVDNFLLLLVGFIVAFFSALIAVRFFLGFIARFNFIPFGVYRIILGVICLFYLDVL